MNQLIQITGAQVPAINLNDITTFRRQRITPEIAQARLAILEAEEDRGQQLTPRRLREVRELGEALTTTTLQREVLIRRNDGADFYIVVFVEDPDAARVRNFMEASRRVDALSSLMVGGGQGAIVEAICTPPRGLEWYHIATLGHMEEVLRHDFLESMKYSVLANLHLLVAAEELAEEPNIYPQILALQTESTNLYQKQINFNRRCAENVLEGSEAIRRNLVAMRGQLLSCGERLEVAPPAFAETCTQLVTEKTQNTLALCEQVKTASETFLEDVKELTRKLNLCLGSLTDAHREVTTAHQKLRRLHEERVDMERRAAEAEAKRVEAEATRTREIGAARVVERKSHFWFLDWGHDELIEADFGSRQLHEEYLELSRQIKQNREAITRAATELEARLAQYGRSTNRAGLERASTSLAAAIASVNELAPAIEIKKSNVENQARVIRQGMLAGTAEKIQTIPQALELMTMLQSTVVHSHAIWIQTEKQVRAIQNIRGEEAKYRTAVIEDIRTHTETGKKAITDVLRRLTAPGTDVPALLQLPTNQKLLEDIRHQ